MIVMRVERMVKPTYYKALWHNCHMCRIHYMSEQPHLRAYLCDECYHSIPHYKVKDVKSQRPNKGSTHKLPHILRDISLTEILLYTLGNLICLIVIGYYLWFK